MKNFLFCLILIITSNSLLLSQVQTKSQTGKIGLCFQIESLDKPIANYSDGVISGVGIKYWILR